MNIGIHFHYDYKDQDPASPNVSLGMVAVGVVPCNFLEEVRHWWERLTMSLIS